MAIPIVKTLTVQTLGAICRCMNEHDNSLQLARVNEKGQYTQSIAASMVVTNWYLVLVVGYSTYHYLV